MLQFLNNIYISIDIRISNMIYVAFISTLPHKPFWSELFTPTQFYGIILYPMLHVGPSTPYICSFLGVRSVC